MHLSSAINNAKVADFSLDLGPVIYSDDKVDMVLFPGGNATVDRAVTYHYYTQDYLGNNRAVVNGSTGAIEQTGAYYPYCAVIVDLGTNPTNQQFILHSV